MESAGQAKVDQKKFTETAKGHSVTNRKQSTRASTSADEKLLASLRQFIRTKGADYLEDPNISSIGVGHKITDGKPTGEVSLQFTVDKKAAEPEALGTEPIPEMIVVDGVAVPTDVIERSYRPAFRVVTEADPPHAKLRVDPILPGVSVGHVRVSAGTIGCIVYDKNDGTPLILSNWHVLHGPAGALGDVIVQPGPHDDNRLDGNRLGQLKRSHLGAAGDCAVATIETVASKQRSPGLTSRRSSWGSPNSMTRWSRTAAPRA